MKPWHAIERELRATSHKAVLSLGLVLLGCSTMGWVLVVYLLGLIFGEPAFKLADLLFARDLAMRVMIAGLITLALLFDEILDLYERLKHLD